MGMKAIILAVAVLVGGWWVAVKLVDDSSVEEVKLSNTDSSAALAPEDSGITESELPDNQLQLPNGLIDTKGVTPAEIIAYAKTLMGTPYKYGSTNPEVGFDCSGFITHVFSKFNIVVPRSSIDFTNVGREVAVQHAAAGDLILFTGTNPEERFVGHMGIVVSNTDKLQFIHSTSGKQYGVTITPLNEYYQRRYVKTIRIFPG